MAFGRAVFEMGRRMERGKVITGIAVLAIAAACFAYAQYNSSDNPSTRVRSGQSGFGEGPNEDALFEAKRMRALNADRHRSMVSDTEKLVKLARQLDVEIASNPTDRLTPEELQKVAAIEKLARNVKMKMAQSFGGGPDLKPPVIDNRGLRGP